MRKLARIEMNMLGNGSRVTAIGQPAEVRFLHTVWIVGINNFRYSLVVKEKNILVLTFSLF